MRKRKALPLKPCVRCGGEKSRGKSKRLCDSCPRLTQGERDTVTKYGMWPKDVASLVRAFNGRCGSCEKKITKGRGLSAQHIDHDHVTGKVRGLLCGRCNVALGLLGETPEGVRGLLEYISWRHC